MSSRTSENIRDSHQNQQLQDANLQFISVHSPLYHPGHEPCHISLPHTQSSNKPEGH